MAESGKSDMRRQFKAKRDNFVAAMGSGERDIAFSQAPSPLRQLFIAGQTVASYIAVGSEANALHLLNAASQAGCTTALPHVINRVAPMRFLQWQPGDALEDGPFGLKQPVQTADVVKPDVILVPLLAFDTRFFRLGQGAGHYDRALSILPDAVAIGIAWSAQETDFIPVDPWDIPMHAVLTEKAWLEK